MANTLTSLNPEKWKSTVQDYLNNMLVAKEVADVRYQDMLSEGDQINFPETSDVYSQTYTPGTDLVAQALVATQSSLVVDKNRAVVVAIDDTEKKQAAADYAVRYAKQSAFRLANEMDKDLLTVGVAGAASTATGGTLDTSTIYDAMVDAHTALFRNNATDGPLFAIMDAKRKGLLSKTFVANGFTQADSALQNGFEGNANGFRVYCSNNIPASVTITIATNPTANDTFTIFGVTFTFVASAAAAGDITIGANAAATQTNISNAIAGTSTGFVDVSADNRAKLKNANAAISAWATNVATISGVGYINASETLTAAADGFGTETTSILFGRVGALALGTQMTPSLTISDIPLQIGKYYKTHTLYGTKVFSRDAYRLHKLTINA